MVGSSEMGEGRGTGFFQREVDSLWGGVDIGMTCVCRLIYFSVCWPGGRATPLGGCGEAGARAALLLLGVSSPTLAFRSIM